MLDDFDESGLGFTVPAMYIHLFLFGVFQGKVPIIGQKEELQPC
jgi:hypothetical protein